MNTSSTFIQKKLHFLPTYADQDVYIRRNTNPDNGGDAYNEMFLCYVDDVLVMSHNPTAIMEDIGAKFQIKNDECGPPEFYLGAGVEKFNLEDGSQCWSMRSDKYVKNAVQTVEDLLAEDGCIPKGGKKNHANCLPIEYKPELDVTEECDEEHASRYCQIIGIL